MRAHLAVLRVFAGFSAAYAQVLTREDSLSDSLLHDGAKQFSRDYVTKRSKTDRDRLIVFLESL